MKNPFKKREETMENLKNEVLLFDREGESLMDGKTIQHCIKFTSFPNCIIIGFSDGSWGIIEEDELGGGRRSSEKFNLPSILNRFFTSFPAILGFLIGRMIEK